MCRGRLQSSSSAVLLAECLLAPYPDAGERHGVTTMPNSDISGSLTKVISPAEHAVLDYGVAATFFAVGLSLLPRHRPAAALAFVNSAMIVGMSMLTDYPGGVFRTLSFKG